MKITFKPGIKDMKRVLHLCLLCWCLWYSLTITGIWAYKNGWLGSIKPVDEFLNNCSKDYYFSSLIIDGNKYYFDDVSGCRPEEGNTTCVHSIKKEGINKFYNQTHEIDPLSKNLLLSLPKNTVIKPDLEELSNYPTISELFNAPLSKLKKVYYLVYWKGDSIKKVFVITSSNPTDYCNKRAIKILNQM